MDLTWDSLLTFFVVEEPLSEILSITMKVQRCLITNHRMKQATSRDCRLVKEILF